VSRIRTRIRTKIKIRMRAVQRYAFSEKDEAAIRRPIARRLASFGAAWRSHGGVG
jgi:hypothetical protein